MRLSDRFCDTLNLLVLVVGVVVFTPLITLKSTLDPALTPQFLAWAVASSVLCLSLVIQAAIRPTAIGCGILRRAIFPAFLGYLLFSILSLTQAVNAAEGIYECLKVAVSLVFLLLATCILLRRTGSVALVAKAAVVTATLVSLIGLYQFFKYGAVDRPGLSLLNGTMGHKNLFASGLFLLVPFCLYTVLACRGFWGVLGMISVAFTLPLIVLTRSRAVWLALFVTTTLAVIIGWTVFRRVDLAIPLQIRRRVLRRTACVMAGCLLVGMLVVVPQVRSHSLPEFVAAATNADSFFERVSVWAKTAEMIRDHAVCGVGAGNWKLVFPSYGLLGEAPPDWLKTVVFVRPHNDFLWAWSEVGTIGFLFYMATFGIPLLYALRVMKQRPWTGDTLLASLMFLGIVGYIVIACFSFSRERIFDTIFVLLMIATVTALYHRHFQTCNSGSHALMVSVLLISQVLLSFAVVAGYRRLNAEVHTKRALAARSVQDWPVVLREIDAACSVFASLDPMATPLKWYRGEANFASNDLSQATLDYEQALAAHPHHIHVLNNLATCYVLADRPAEAVRLYEEAIRIFPQFAEAVCNLAAVYFRRGDYAKAHDVLLRCGPDVQNATLERYRRIVAEKLAGDTASASDRSTSAAARASSSPAPAIADKLKSVHRLWSSFYGRYFYTMDRNECDAFLSRRQQGWVDEGVAYRAFTDRAIPGLAPVHRLYSPAMKGYLYTISPSEAQRLTQDYADQWRYEGTAFYAFPEGQQPQGASPVHRFWSPPLQYHLYTLDENEAEQLKTLHKDTWSYEGVAWYAYGDGSSVADVTASNPLP